MLGCAGGRAPPLSARLFWFLWIGRALPPSSTTACTVITCYVWRTFSQVVLAAMLWQYVSAPGAKSKGKSRKSSKAARATKGINRSFPCTLGGGTAAAPALAKRVLAVCVRPCARTAMQRQRPLMCTPPPRQHWSRRVFHGEINQLPSFDQMAGSCVCACVHVCV